VESEPQRDAFEWIGVGVLEGCSCAVAEKRFREPPECEAGADPRDRSGFGLPPHPSFGYLKHSLSLFGAATALSKTRLGPTIARHCYADACEQSQSIPTFLIDGDGQPR